MFAVCDQFAQEFDLKFNSSKSVALRICLLYTSDAADE